MAKRQKKDVGAKVAATVSTATASPKPVRPAVPKAITGGIRVEATKLGYYNHTRRRPGDVFTVASDTDVSSKWMRRVDPDTPETITTPNEAIKQQHDDILQMRHAGPSAGIHTGRTDVPAHIPTGEHNPLGDDFDDET